LDELGERVFALRSRLLRQVKQRRHRPIRHDRVPQ